MNKSIKKINGKEVEYLDVVHHTTTTKFGFWDRIKILLGKEVITNSELYTDHEHCIIVGSTAKTHVPPIITRKQKGGYVMSPMDPQESRDNKLKNILK